MMIDLQMFGGGGSQETVQKREIPKQSDEEAMLQDMLMNYGVGSLGRSAELVDRGMGYLDQAYTPDWNEVVDNYINRNDAAFNTYQDWSLDRQRELQDKLDSYNQYVYDHSNDYLSDLEGDVASYRRNMQSALRDNETANREYKNNMQSALRDNEAATNTFRNAMNSYLRDYDRSMAGVTSKMEDLTNGVLPSQYATNRQAALNADLRGTMGRSVNDLANRGVINSSVGNRAFNDISQSASDTLAKAYRDDLAMEASLLGQQGQNYQNVYGTRSGNAKSQYDASNTLYGNRVGNYGSILDSANTLYGNRVGNYGSVLGAQADLYGNQMSNLNNLYDKYAGSSKDVYDRQSSFANNWIQNNYAGNQANLNGMVTAQSASFEPVSQYLGYAEQLANPARDLYNQMYSGRMGTGTVSTTQSGGNNGAWGAVGALGSAAIMACFTGDTLVATPEGYVYIKDIEAGDRVLSMRGGEVVPKAVTYVHEPVMADVLKVKFSDGTVWHTTETQRYFDGAHFHSLKATGAEALSRDGSTAHVLKVEPEGKELVYDFKVEGFAGENVFFANDMAAEGIGD